MRDVTTGKDLPDLIQWTKGSVISWATDDRGFYYSRFPEPPPEKLLTVAALNEKVYFHKLGDPQSADKLVYERPDHRNWTIDPLVMEGSRYLLLYIYTGVSGKNMLAVQDLKAANPKTAMLIPSADYGYGPIAVVGSTLYLQTNDGAPRGRVIAMDLEHPERANWKEIVPERAETLDSAQIAGGKLLLSYMKDAHSAARLVSLDGKGGQEIAMPGIGTARMVQRPARGQGNVLQVRRFHYCACHLPAGFGDGQERGHPAEQSCGGFVAAMRRGRFSIRAKTARACQCSSVTRRGWL